ncbi:MAG: TolC family protein [Pyrinomonadaceae bacterium]|nr:TolC family protein [Sphingobacteriaceae bacterium]
MIKRVTLISIVAFIFIFNPSNAQEAPVSLMDDISYVFVEKLIAIAKENYPRVKSHNSRIAMAKGNIINQKMTWLSPLSLNYVYSPANTLNLTNPTFFSGYQIGFSFNLGSVLQYPGNVKRAREELTIELLSRDEYYLSLVTEVKSRYFTYLAEYKSLKLLNYTNQDALNLANMLKDRYKKGEVAFTEYNTAATALSTSTQAKLNAESSFLRAKASLEELLGIRLEEVN